MSHGKLAWIGAWLGLLGCGGEKVAVAPLVGGAPDAGTPTQDGGAQNGDAGSKQDGKADRLDPSAVYLYGYLRDWNNDWQAVARFDAPGQKWVGLPSINNSDATRLVGLRQADGLPVYFEPETVRAAQADGWTVEDGITPNVINNDTILARCQYPERVGSAQLVAETDEVLYQCCAEGSVTTACTTEDQGCPCPWYLGDEKIDKDLGTSRVLRVARGPLALVRSGASQLSLWSVLDGSIRGVEDGPRDIVATRASADGFWVTSGKAGVDDAAADRHIQTLWTIAANGKATKGKEYGALPAGKEVVSCAISAEKELVCLTRDAAGTAIYYLTAGTPLGEPIREYPATATHPIEPPYVRPGGGSVMVTGVGPKPKN